MAAPPVIGVMAAIPPALRYRVLDTVARFDRGDPRDQVAALLACGAGWLGAEPSLAEVGYWLVDPARDAGLRALGCAWLGLFPSIESIERLAAIALEPQPAPVVRGAAITALADRQLRGLHPSTLWTTDAVQLADDTLFKLADAATTAGRTGRDLPLALRHVQSDGLAAVFARAPALWGAALEAFATPPLSRVLAVSIDDIAPAHRVRVLRLIAATLGEDSMPLIISRASSGAVDERLEAMFLAITLGGESHVPRLEAALHDAKHADLLRKRAKWHLANKGVIPTVRGLRIARGIATIPVADRAAKAAQAADDLGALVRFGRHAEPYVYELWGWMVRAAGDPMRAKDLVAAHPGSQALVRDLLLADLARRGRVRQAIAAAHGSPDIGALQLAIYGRPFAALELAATATRHTPELVCARALACYRAGRPDLADRVLAVDLPAVAITDDEVAHEFPGPDERWYAEHAPALRPAVTALVDGRRGVLALAAAAHHEAEPDVVAFDGLDEVERRLRGELRGATVYVVGELRPQDRIAITNALERAGAQIVAGPVPGTDRYFAGERAEHAIAQLEARGIRRISREELG